LFTLFGLVIIAMILFQRLTNSKSLTTNAMFLTSLMTGYGASMIYYVRTNAKQLFLEHWEVCLGYIILSCTLGLGATQFARQSDTLKHSIIVLVKWFLRCIGLVFVYNAFASPLISLVSIVLLSIVYVIYEIYKFFARVFSFRDTKKQE